MPAAATHFGVGTHKKPGLRRTQTEECNINNNKGIVFVERMRKEFEQYVCVDKHEIFGVQS